MSILKLDNVRKTYENTIAVDDVSFEMSTGSIFGLLGPNGAGKTSLIRIITTITAADSGTVYIDGDKLNDDHPSQIGYMPEERGLYKKMKVGEHIMYLARLKGLSKQGAKREIEKWFEKFRIEGWWSKKVEELSKGMQQKIQFIATVIHKPKLIILDEPFSGLDPLNTNLIKDEIYKLKESGTSIIFSTHRMEQVEEVCEHIVLINQGKNVLEGSVKDIKNRFKENLFQIEFEGEIPDDFADKANVVNQEKGRITVQLQEDFSSNELLKTFLDNNNYVHSFHEILPTLNEIFIRQVNNENN